MIYALQLLHLRINFLNSRFNYPPTKSTKVLIKGERGSYAESLHKGEAGAIRKAESLVRILTEDGPSLFFVGRRDSDNGCCGLAQQAKSELERRLIAESHAEEGDRFMNDHIAGDEESIRGLHVLESLVM